VYPTQEVLRVDYVEGMFLITCQERGFTLEAPTHDPIARRVPIEQGIAAFERLVFAKHWE